MTIKNEERDFQILKPFETISLLSKKSLQKHRDKQYKYIHIGLVQIRMKLLTKEGLNTSILAVLRDTRFINFQESLLSLVESILCSGPISFNCYPNFNVSLNDSNITKSLILQIKTHNYKMLDKSIPFALIYKIHYKTMVSAFTTKHKFQSKRGETLLLQIDLTKSNTAIPRSIQCKHITLPEE